MPVRRWAAQECGPATDHLHYSHSGRSIKPWEYWLGDKAYIGCPEFLTEFKKPIGGQLTAEQIEWNLLLQHYRMGHMVKSGHTPGLDCPFCQAQAAPFARAKVPTTTAVAAAATTTATTSHS